MNESSDPNASFRSPVVPLRNEVAEMARRLAFESPQLSDLTPEQLERVAQAVVARNLTDDLKQRSDLAKIDYQGERVAFLKQAGKTESPATRRAYSAALDRLDAWAEKKGLAPLEMKFKDADDFIYALQTQLRAPASIRLDAAAVSSFFTFLERRFEPIRNPFRGTKARPEKKPLKEPLVPTSEEVSILLSEVQDPVLRAAIAVMATRGLRVGALQSLAIREGRFTAKSKGKTVSGAMPDEVVRVIAAAGLGTRSPFADRSKSQIADRFRYWTTKLVKVGKLSARFSVHDLRHYYAVEQYTKDKDIYALKGLLGHASIQVTESYLRSLSLL